MIFFFHFFGISSFFYGISSFYSRDFPIPSSLPYVEATIRESLRHETLLPSNVPHTSMAETKFSGYDIPKVIFFQNHAEM